MNSKNKKVVGTILLLVMILGNASPIFAAQKGDVLDIVCVGTCEEYVYGTLNGSTFLIDTCYTGYYENGKFYPVYCLERLTPGVDLTREYAVEVDDITQVAQNEEIWRVLVNGFPYKSAAEMGLPTDTQAFACTKQAIYAILDGRDPNSYTAKNAQGEKMVEVIKRLIDIGRNGTQTYTDPVINVNAVNQAGVDNINSKYVSQTFYVTSQVNMKDINILLNTNGMPTGTFVADTNNNAKTSFNKDEYFKILVPRDSIQGKITVQATVDGACEVYPVLYGKAPAGLQDYAMVTDPFVVGGTTLTMNYEPDAEIIIKKISTADSEITGIGAGEVLANAKFLIESEDGTFKTTQITDSNGMINLNVELGKYIITELQAPEYYLEGKEAIQFEVELKKDGEIVEVVVENMPVKIKTNVDKTADKEEVQGNEVFNYEIDNIKNLSNVELNNFTLTDNLPAEVRIQKIETGTYNQDTKYSITYNTNKKQNVLLEENLSTKTNNILDFTNISLATDEYITSFSMNFGTVRVGFINTNKVKVTTKVVEGLNDNDTFTNNVIVTGSYLDATTKDEDEEITEVYENILKLKKVTKEYNQYTELEAGTAINAVFDLLDDNKEYITTLNVKDNEETIVKYLETGKQYYLKEISTDNYYVISEELIPFMFEENGQTVNLIVENDNVNLIVDVEKEAPTEAQKGEIIDYTFNNIGNFSNTKVSNFTWGDKLPRQVRVQELQTGTWNEELEYKIQYITNKNTNWKNIGEAYLTSENYTIDLTNTTLGLADDEYVSEIRLIFGEVKEGFQAEVTPIIKAKVNEDVQNNKIFVNETYVTADYMNTKLNAEDDAHTIVYTKKPDIDKELPKTGIDD